MDSSQTKAAVAGGRFRICISVCGHSPVCGSWYNSAGGGFRCNTTSSDRWRHGVPLQARQGLLSLLELIKLVTCTRSLNPRDNLVRQAFLLNSVFQRLKHVCVLFDAAVCRLTHVSRFPPPPRPW